ncbi:MAG: hypothetical protein WA584_08450 [Pyrinomonadaceae bacterium]
MLIFGKTNDDKGTQLERIASFMLAEKNYVDIRLNAVRNGAAEYDLTANYLLPVVGSNPPKKIHVVGECKARSKKIDMDDWQKFLGKVFLEERTRNGPVYGLYVTTANLNPNVYSCYDDLREQPENNIDLVDAAQIEEFLRARYSVCSLAKAAQSVSKYTERTANFEMFYYREFCGWFVQFDHGYSLLDFRGNLIDGPRLPELQSIIENPEAPENKDGIPLFIDLQKEIEAANHRLLLKKHILSRLMVFSGVATEADLIEKTPFTIEEIKQPVQDLRKQGWVETENDLVSFTHINGEGYFEHFTEVLKFLLVDRKFFLPPLLEMLMSKFYDNHINDSFLDEIVAIQADLNINEDEREKIIYILKLSPSALATVLSPIQMITEGRTEQMRQEAPDVNFIDYQHFCQYLIIGLLKDYDTQGLEKHFLEIRGIEELRRKFDVSINFFGGKNIVINTESRHQIRTSNTSTGYIHLIPIRGDKLEDN